MTDDDGVRHRLWLATDERDDGAATALAAAAGAGPCTIADGHHRYETALRYRDERRMTRSCEEDPPFDYLLMLFLDAADELTVLPTHRVVRGLGEDGVARLPRRPAAPVRGDPVVARTSLVRRFEAAGELAGGEGRFGLVTRDGALAAGRPGGRPSPSCSPTGGEAVRALDVTLLAAALDAVLGHRRRGGRGRRADRLHEVGRRGDRGSSTTATTAPMPRSCSSRRPSRRSSRSSRDGDVMPQKSTYFYPKALTGLVINPHEW